MSKRELDKWGVSAEWERQIELALVWGASDFFWEESGPSTHFPLAARFKYSPLSTNSWEQEPEHYIRRSKHGLTRLLCLGVKS